KVKEEYLVTKEDKPSEEDVSDTSKPPGFENFIKENSECLISSYASRSGKCSTSFGNYKIKDLKGFSFIDEMSQMIEVGGTLGYDVKGYKKSLWKMINEIDNVNHDIPNLQVVALDRRWSDHNPILIHSKKFDFGPTPFRIFHSWFDRIDFEKVVKDKWDDITGEVPGLASDEDKSSRISKLQELDYFEKMNSLDLMQKVRVKWEVEGDENSKFFHGLINSRRKSQSIHGIMHEGVWLSNPKDIKEAFLNFYKKKFSCHDSQVLFSSFMPAYRLNTSNQDLLEAVVSIKEIKTAVWDCGSNKAPGPDGYSFLFIKRLWDLLKHDIQEFVDSFFSSGKFPQGVNSVFITLIPKVSNPLFVKDYRPISLIGLHYKIVAKILSNRLSKDFYSHQWESYFEVLSQERFEAMRSFVAVLIHYCYGGSAHGLNDGIASNMFYGVRIGSNIIFHIFSMPMMLLFSRIEIKMIWKILQGSSIFSTSLPVLRLIFTNLMSLELEFQTVKLSPWLHVLVVKQILIDRFKARLSVKSVAGLSPQPSRVEPSPQPIRVHSRADDEPNPLPKETRNLGLKKITNDKGPVLIRFEWDDKKTLMPLGDHASHWSNYLGELIREMPLYYPSWKKVPAERNAAILTKIGTQFDLTPHMQSQRWTDINAGIQQHLQKLYNTNKTSLKAAHWVINPETGTYDVESIRQRHPQNITPTD
nr:RNA-directed DNA polymerase, eukaryota [Tanacetum cinerariifolium]